VWEPTASGLAPAGDLGWTVGEWTWSANDPGGGEARGSYVTVWRRQADGSWKVLFDTGDPI
jgi:ketosteroid isomerase-like protein